MSESPKSSKIDIVKDAAKRAMALTEVAAVAVAGVATMDALVEPGSASAGTEAAMTHEGQSPQAFINTFNHNFSLATGQMDTSPHYKPLSVGKVNKLSKSKVVFKIISLPSKQYPGRFDILDVAVQGDQTIPDSAEIFVGADSKSVQDVKDWKHAYNVVTTAGLGQGRWLAYEEDSGPASVSHAENMYVSTGGYSTISPDNNHITYNQKTAKRISSAYNGFLTRMHAMIAQK